MASDDVHASAAAPPPLPANITVVPPTETAVKTYTRTALWMVVPTIAWLFCTIILMPKVRYEWQQLGSPGANLASIFALVEFPQRHGRVIAALGIVALILLERFDVGWPRRRRAVLAAFTWGYTTVMLVLLAAIATLCVVMLSLVRSEA